MNGLHVFAAADATKLTTDPIPLAGSPTDIALVCDAAIACGDPACPAPQNCVVVPALGPAATSALILIVLSGALIRLGADPRRH